MLSVAARLWLAGEPAPPTREWLVTELTRAGLTFEADRPRSEAGSLPAAWVLAFGQLTGEVLDEVRVASAWGRNRVLAIALAEAALTNSDMWSLLRSGASDVVRWNRRDPPAREVVARIERWAEVDLILRSDAVRGKLIGDGPTWVALLRQIVEVAAFNQTSVLLTGESGTGKELVAQLIHALDPRPAKGPLVVVDCTTVVPTLSGSEFFGHERGAFTGAVSARDGAFGRADGGTLFLDEIGELPLPLQAELLRVIQEGTYKRVGSDTWRDTQFRLVCATNRPLKDAVAAGQFRSDLFHRIAAWSCELPPLRQRRDDILDLASHFLSELVTAPGRPPFDPAVTDFLLRREYPGNIRELRFLVARIAARHIGHGSITVGSLPEAERPAGNQDPAVWWRGSFEEAVGNAVSLGAGLREIGRVAQQTAVGIAVTAERGNLRRAAQRLGVTERALQLRRSSGSLSLQPPPPATGLADPVAAAPADGGERPLSPDAV